MSRIAFSQTNVRLPRRSGFTLVELLIVLGILVMLFAIVGPRVLSSGKKADVNVARTQIGSFKAILDNYYLDLKTFPTTEQGLIALVERPDDLPDDANWDGPYMDGNLPKDPWGRDYLYEYPSSHEEGRDFPDIWSLGPDRQEDSGDEIINWKSDEDESDRESSSTE